MAQVTEEIHRHIDVLLDHSLDRWRRLPQVEAEIDQWDLIDQLVFIEEWPLEEQHLEMLDRYASAGNLTSDQLRRLQELKETVGRNRPIIRRLQHT